MTMDLHTYFRSSASYRVRIALNLKGLKARPHHVHLTRGGGEQLQPAYTALNPQALLPLLEEDGLRISQSLAIMEYLDEAHPGPRLLPQDAAARARVRELSLAIACDIHPLNNLRVLKFLTGDLGLSEQAKLTWIAHWISIGFTALEATLTPSRSTGDGPFCVGATPTMADCCLVPQWFNAERFSVDLAPYPTLAAIVDACNALPAFQEAHPAMQPDAE
jgi:maleylacetoacetate isomerase